MHMIDVAVFHAKKKKKIVMQNVVVLCKTADTDLHEYVMSSRGASWLL